MINDKLVINARLQDLSDKANAILKLLPERSALDPSQMQRAQSMFKDLN